MPRTHRKSHRRRAVTRHSLVCTASIQGPARHSRHLLIRCGCCLPLLAGSGRLETEPNCRVSWRKIDQITLRAGAPAQGAACGRNSNNGGTHAIRFTRASYMGQEVEEVQMEGRGRTRCVAGGGGRWIGQSVGPYS